MREDRNITELLTANYTFVDELLAKHYGIPDIYGSRFRRVTLPAACCSVSTRQTPSTFTGSR